ncbi:MAG TPA: TIGR03435 family protein [Acidobacteriaceae bacterium]|jgi:uncharacterized protein (TIGR03435 family)|nr:TIGR03435 family protein [Acidobacteriaceae bacterium]
MTDRTATSGSSWLTVVAAALLVACPVHARQPAPPPSGTEANRSATFEVASIAPVPESRRGSFYRNPDGTDLFVVRNAPLPLLVSLAYNMDTRNIVGMPSRLDDHEFDISARAEGHPKLSYEQLQPYLQNLLRDRFHLTVHRSTRDQEGYALVVAKSGSKMKAIDAGKGSGDAQDILPNGIEAPAATMEMLASFLSRPAGAEVVDQTGLIGNYAINLKYRARDSEDSSLPSMFTALQEQLGLKLVRRRVPTTILVVDHVDGEPTPN